MQSSKSEGTDPFLVDSRPSLHQFVTDSPEYYRWYEYGGNARQAPLSLEELESYLQQERGYSKKDALRAAKQSGARPAEAENSVEKTELQRAEGSKENQRASVSQEAHIDKASQAPFPDALRKHYIQVGGKFFYDKNPDQLAFEDKGHKLVTKSSGTGVATSLVQIAEARGWSEIRVRGSEEFRRHVWLKARARNLPVGGYEPQEKDFAALEKELRGKSVSKDRQSIEGKATDPLSGHLLEHGPAPFEFKEENQASYFAKLRNSDGKERVVWGVDLERALNEAKVEIGEYVTFENHGKKPVTIDRPVKNELGEVVGSEKVEAQRNIWSVKAQAVKEKTPEQLVKEYPDLANEAATVKLAEKVASRFSNPPDQQKFLDQVKNRVATQVSQGQASPQIKIRASQQVQGKGAAHVQQR